jgi:hypothetical protein
MYNVRYQLNLWFLFGKLTAREIRISNMLEMGLLKYSTHSTHSNIQTRRKDISFLCFIFKKIKFFANN